MFAAPWISPVLQLLHFQAGHPGSSKAASQGQLQHRGTDELLGHFIPQHNQVKGEKYYQELGLSQQNCVCRLPEMSKAEPGCSSWGSFSLGLDQDCIRSLPVFPSWEFPRVTAPHNCSACPHTKVWVTLSPPWLVFNPLWAQPPSQTLLPSKIPFKIPHFPHLFLQAPQVFYLLTKILLKISFFSPPQNCTVSASVF